MIALVEGASRQKTPNEIALSILLSKFTIIFLIVCVALQPFAIYAGGRVSDAVLIALFVCLIPTTIGGLLSAIGIAGMDRLVQRNVLAMSGRAVEAAGDVSTLLLDKTGTITLGNRQAVGFFPRPASTSATSPRRRRSRPLADETPEGRSIVVLAKEMYGVREHDLLEMRASFVPFTAQTRMSGIDYDGTEVRKGAVDAIVGWTGSELPPVLESEVERIAQRRRYPARGGDGPRRGRRDRAEGHHQGRLTERFAQLRKMGIHTVMITGDNTLTAAAIARESGVDDFLAEATPETKMDLIRREQEGGKLVAMTGDGTNDAPALAQADVGVAMNTGTAAAKEAGNMVDLDSNPTKLMSIVEIGKQLLITRGSLTTFSIANDVAKYFAIIPAMFVGTYPVLEELNVMNLETPESAILSAVIFNALVIVALVPAGPARCPLPAGRGRCAAAPEPPDLRPRRHHRAVHRDQVDRHAPGVGEFPMMRNVLRALLAVIVLGVLTGLVYPLVITGVAQLTLDDKADGSLVRIDEQVVGSASIGQLWEGTDWFHGRPSAVDYDAGASSGSNLGPTSQELADLVQERVDGVLELEGPYIPNLTAADIPADLVTASSSGLDPHISVASAELQAAPIRRGARASRPSRSCG